MTLNFKYHKVASSRPVYCSILELLGQRSEYIRIKFSHHKPSENPWGLLLTETVYCSQLYGMHNNSSVHKENYLALLGLTFLDRVDVENSRYSHFYTPSQIKFEQEEIKSSLHLKASMPKIVS